MKLLADVILLLLMFMIGAGLTLFGLYFGGYELPEHWGTGYAVVGWALVVIRAIAKRLAEYDEEERKQ